MEKKCKHCAMMIPKEAKVCPYCRKKQGTSFAVGCFTVFLILIIIGIAVSAFKEQHTSAPVQVEKAQPENASAPVQVEKAQPENAVEMGNRWKYSEAKDEMSGKVTKLATNESINTVNFEFPYQGEQRGTIMVFNDTVLFYVKKGQVICHGGNEYGTCVVRVKFDDTEERYVSARKSGDDSTAIAFTEPGFLNNIKISKKLMIQVEVFHNGLPVFTFDVQGLIQE